MKKIILCALMGISLFSSAEESNISISKEKYEIVIQGGVETRFKTGTLKPIMIFEEVITIKNISEGHIKSVLYDFKLDRKSVLHSNLDLGDDIEVLYSRNDGVSYFSFPILNENDEAIKMKEYTDIRMIISKIMNGNSKELKVRYSYDHFAQ